MNAIYQFFNHPFFIIFGGITATIVLLGVLLNIIFWILGIAPLLKRLGYGRWFRKIAIVANNDNYNSLKGDLVDSGIFREKNILQIYSQTISKVKDENLLLVHYQSFDEAAIKTILANKKSNAGMIFYYPGFSPKDGKEIPIAVRDQISNTENTTIVNFRGRLLNDIITTLITTSYGKK
ncbi:MAG: hypothetical protein ACYDIA_20395 [Candidatus Humimicrobiaceae bacterium]